MQVQSTDHSIYLLTYSIVLNACAQNQLVTRAVCIH